MRSCHALSLTFLIVVPLLVSSATGQTADAGSPEARAAAVAPLTDPVAGPDDAVAAPANPGVSGADDAGASLTGPASLAPGHRGAFPADPAAGAPALDPSPVVHVIWQGHPIAVDLQVQRERRIDFPEPIADLDIPQALESQSRIVLTPEGRLHWTARAPFEPARVLATSLSGTLYQLDVGARAGGAAPARLAIRDPVLDAAARPPAPTAQARLDQVAGELIPGFLKGDATGSARPPDPVALARFALAHYAGPARLVPALTASRVPVRPLATRAWIRVQAATLQVRPLAQWQAGERYVTALEVANRGAWPVAFDPRALRGDLIFAAALHPTLAPAGSGHHRTVWAVVTAKPFNQAVAVHAVPVAR